MDVSPRRVLHWIAGFECLKGFVAGLVGLSLEIGGPVPVRATIATLARGLHLDAPGGMLARLADSITAERVHLAAAVALVYALMRFVEAYGLWRLREWASWFGAISAGVYLPFEIIALLRHPHVLEATILALNVAVVLYLIHDIRRRHPSRRPRSAQ